jgi:hypothetical protein
MLVKTGNIKISRVKNIHESYLWLFRLFVQEAGEYERTPISILEQARKSAERNGSFWLISKGVEPVGYFFAEIVPSEYGTLVCLIHQVFIMARHSKPGLIRTIDGIIGAWGRNNGAAEVAFLTRRNPQAFLRYLGGDWILDSHIIKRSI